MNIYHHDYYVFVVISDREDTALLVVNAEHRTLLIAEAGHKETAVAQDNATSLLISTTAIWGYIIKLSQSS